MQTKYVADDLGQDHPGAVFEDCLQRQHFAPSSPCGGAFFTKEKLFVRYEQSIGPMAETYAEAVQGLLSWFKSRSGLQCLRSKENGPSFGPGP
jgi:hypothetical protein